MTSILIFLLVTVFSLTLFALAYNELSKGELMRRDWTRYLLLAGILACYSLPIACLLIFLVYLSGFYYGMIGAALFGLILFFPLYFVGKPNYSIIGFLFDFALSRAFDFTDSNLKNSYQLYISDLNFYPVFFGQNRTARNLLKNAIDRLEESAIENGYSWIQRRILFHWRWYAPFTGGWSIHSSLIPTLKRYFESQRLPVESAYTIYFLNTQEHSEISINGY